MHLYMSSVGFSEYPQDDLEELIRRENALLPASLKDYSSSLDRGFASLPVSKDLAVYSMYKKSNIYCSVPYVTGEPYEQTMEVDIERHSLTETYAVCCDCIKQGVSLIFHLVNCYDYIRKARDNGFSINSGNTIKVKGISLAGLADTGMILLPVTKTKKQMKAYSDSKRSRDMLIAAAKEGDEQAIESLTIEELDTYTQISRRVAKEDIFTIVDSTFMPTGVECEMYSVIGEIMSVEVQDNGYSGQEVYVMLLDCNDLLIKVAVNMKNLIGEPAVGRRFKGAIWLHGEVIF